MFLNLTDCLTTIFHFLTNYNEELLTQHEQKLEDLKFKYDEGIALYEKTSKWMDLWNEYVETSIKYNIK